MESRTVKELEDIIRKKPTIRFKTPIEFKDFKDVIKFTLDWTKMPNQEHLREWERKNYDRATVFKTTNTIQCYNGARRGIYDSYRIVLHYFPDTTFKEFWKVFKKNEGGWCSSTNQSTYRYDRQQSGIHPGIIRIGREKFKIKLK